MISTSHHPIRHAGTTITNARILEIDSSRHHHHRARPIPRTNRTSSPESTILQQQQQQQSRGHGLGHGDSHGYNDNGNDNNTPDPSELCLDGEESTSMDDGSISITSASGDKSHPTTDFDCDLLVFINTGLQHKKSRATRQHHEQGGHEEDLPHDYDATEWPRSPQHQPQQPQARQSHHTRPLALGRDCSNCKNYKSRLQQLKVSLKESLKENEGLMQDAEQLLARYEHHQVKHKVKAQDKHFQLEKSLKQVLDRQESLDEAHSLISSLKKNKTKQNEKMFSLTKELKSCKKQVAKLEHKLRQQKELHTSHHTVKVRGRGILKFPRISTITADNKGVQAAPEPLPTCAEADEKAIDSEQGLFLDQSLLQTKERINEANTDATSNDLTKTTSKDNAAMIMRPRLAPQPISTKPSPKNAAGFWFGTSRDDSSTERRVDAVKVGDGLRRTWHGDATERTRLGLDMLGVDVHTLFWSFKSEVQEDRPTSNGLQENKYISDKGPHKKGQEKKETKGELHSTASPVCQSNQGVPCTTNSHSASPTVSTQGGRRPLLPHEKNRKQKEEKFKAAAAKWQQQQQQKTLKTKEEKMAHLKKKMSHSAPLLLPDGEDSNDEEELDDFPEDSSDSATSSMVRIRKSLGEGRRLSLDIVVQDFSAGTCSGATGGEANDDEEECILLGEPTQDYACDIAGTGTPRVATESRTSTCSTSQSISIHDIMALPANRGMIGLLVSDKETSRGSSNRPATPRLDRKQHEEGNSGSRVYQSMPSNTHAHHSSKTSTSTTHVGMRTETATIRSTIRYPLSPTSQRPPFPLSRRLIRKIWVKRLYHGMPRPHPCARPCPRVVL
jgi:hypothetical protein